MNFSPYRRQDTSGYVYSCRLFIKTEIEKNWISVKFVLRILEKEKHIAEEENEEEGGDSMPVFAISSLISHLSEYIISQSEIKEE
jgi:hypothetical protein